MDLNNTASIIKTFVDRNGKNIPFEIGYYINIWDRVYLGPMYNSTYHTINETEPGGILDEEGVTGSETMYSSGLGASLKYNNTDSGLYHRKGIIAEGQAVFYSKAFGSATNFQTISLDYRQYFPLFSRCVLAVQFKFGRVTGDAPFYYLPSLGGNKLLRGYSGGRYIAPNKIAGQAEFRFPIFWRLGGVVFAGAGEVAESLNDFGSNIREAGGAGLRFRLEKNQNINLRLDVTYNSDGDSKTYIKIKEAF